MCGYLLLDKHMQQLHLIIITSDKNRDKLKIEHHNDKMSLFILWPFLFLLDFYSFEWQLTWIYFNIIQNQKHTRITIQYWYIDQSQIVLKSRYIIVLINTKYIWVLECCKNVLMKRAIFFYNGWYYSDNCKGIGLAKLTEWNTVVANNDLACFWIYQALTPWIP